jgi:PIN domain nuclease of toxin-antitoxin system
MRFLLDTQVAIWALLDAPRLSRAAREILDDSENRLLFSVCSIWEIATKRALKRPGFQFDPRLIRQTLLRYGCEELAIESPHAFEVEHLPPIHKDPFDRILIAQAMVEGITLLTADPVIAKYPGPIRKV